MKDKLFNWLRNSAMIYCWLCLLILIIIMYLFPVANGSTRLFFVIALPSLWIVTVSLLRKHKWVAFSILVPGILFSLFLFLPGSKPNVTALRASYVESLKKYEGTTYVWGGENWVGIDCSGLVRNGLINANLKQSFLTFNPQLFRKAFRLWWYDCSAKALRDGYKDFAIHLFKANSINEIDHTKLLPGDIAITKSGKHVLAYLGKNKWIEADPGFRETLIEVVPSKNPWFQVRVYVLRWVELQDQKR